jgi:hypothetical protein
MSEKKTYRLSHYGINLLKANAVVSGFQKKRYQKISLCGLTTKISGGR